MPQDFHAQTPPVSVISSGGEAGAERSETLENRTFRISPLAWQARIVADKPGKPRVTRASECFPRVAMLGRDDMEKALCLQSDFPFFRKTGSLFLHKVGEICPDENKIREIPRALMRKNREKLQKPGWILHQKNVR